MPFERPKTTKNYVDIYEETKRGPRLLAFRVLDVDLPPEDGRYPDPENPGQKQKIYPVLADCMIIDGPNAGKVFMRKIYKYAITNALRGPDANGNPTVVPPAEIGVRAERGKGANSNAVFGNEPDEEELATIDEVFEQFGGWPQPASTPGVARQPAAAGPAAAGPAAGPAATRPGPGARPADSRPAEAPAVQRPGPGRPGPARLPGRPGPTTPAPAQRTGSGSASPFGPRRPAPAQQ